MIILKPGSLFVEYKLKKIKVKQHKNPSVLEICHVKMADKIILSVPPVLLVPNKSRV